MAYYISIIKMKIVRSLYRILFLFPIKKKRILFHSFLGESYSCNPKYICESLMKDNKDLQMVWAFKEPDKYEDLKNITKVKYNTLKMLYYQATSHFVIVNNAAIWTPRRKNQVVIDTWHGGGCYKRVAENAASKTSKQKDFSDYRRLLSSKETNLMISSSKFFSDNVIRKAFKYNGKILECGMPRNDVLINETSYDMNEKLKLKKQIFKQYNIDFDSNFDSYIVLYAPTWRKVSGKLEELDSNVLKSAIQQRFGKNALLFSRGHHTSSNLSKNGFVDVTDYRDMQELLLISDMLITDYSSSIWDYSFLYRPTFLFTPDLEEYRKSPGFEYEIETWGFPIAQTNEEIYKEIKEFDYPKFVENMQHHHEFLGSFEEGKSCEIIKKIILNRVNKRDRK